MKENELIRMRNKINNLEGRNEAMMIEIMNLKGILNGMLGILKEMPGYQTALDQIKENTQADTTKNNEV